MSLDQRLSQAARRMTDGITPPEVDLGAVRARARRSQRRTAVLAIAATVLTVGATGAVVVGGRDDAAPLPADPSPSPSPSVVETTSTQAPWSPDSITAEEVVNDPDARPRGVGVAAGDPDVRLSIWATSADSAIAVTTDGYRTTTYASAPVADGELNVSSPRDDLFLLSKVNKDKEWLVGVDGTVRRVARVRGEVAPDDPRLWFQCSDGGWRYTWCALDPDRATAHVWPGRWDGSAVPPGEGAFPWGANPEPRAVGSTGQLEAWWDTGSGRSVRTLASADNGDYVLECRPDLMALWSHASGTSTVEIHVSRDRGATWQVSSYEASAADLWWQVRCLPDGSFLASSGEEGLALWRAEESGDTFRRVFKAPGESTPGSVTTWTPGDRDSIAAAGIAASTTDDGRTWTAGRTWR